MSDIAVTCSPTLSPYGVAVSVSRCKADSLCVNPRNARYSQGEE